MLEHQQAFHPALLLLCSDIFGCRYSRGETVRRDFQPLRAKKRKRAEGKKRSVLSNSQKAQLPIVFQLLTTTFQKFPKVIKICQLLAKCESIIILMEPAIIFENCYMCSLLLRYQNKFMVDSCSNNYMWSKTIRDFCYCVLILILRQYPSLQASGTSCAATSAV